MRGNKVNSIVVLVVAALAACSSPGSEGAAPSPSTTTTTPESTPSTRARDVDLAEEVEGPVTGGDRGLPLLSLPEGWADEHGYAEEEYHLAGEATAYASREPLSPDGRWTVRPAGEPAPYRTRILARWPEDDEAFSGTVVVEWLNVTFAEADPEFGYLAEEILEAGDAYLGVSAQAAGIEGLPVPLTLEGVPADALLPLTAWDPSRYGDLRHPGDAYSYDIFGQAARTAIETGPLAHLPVDRLIAVGESQSASRLLTYANAVQPRTDLFDGFFLQIRDGAAAPLGDDPAQAAPTGTRVRSDGTTPVLQVVGETDVERLGFVAARQPDGDHLVTWEVAGAAHADQSTLRYANLQFERWLDTEIEIEPRCGLVNDGPMREVAQAAWAGLHRWVQGGERPPAAEPLQTDAAGVIERDELGLALGGVRTPDVETPTAVNTGISHVADPVCDLFGSTEPLTPRQLADRYGDQAAFEEDVAAAAAAAVDAGYLLPRHARLIEEEAATVVIP